MNDLLQFLKAYELWSYLLLGVVGIFYFRKLAIAWMEWRNALFGLERESAQRKMNAALAVVVIVILLATAEFLLVTFVAPVYPSGNLMPTPTLNLLATPTVTLAPGAAAVEKATATPFGSQGCVPNVLEWTSPQPGEEVQGAFDLRAVINFDDLGFYKYEYGQPGSTNWSTIAAGNTRIVDEVLGTWNTDQLTPGDYILRLVATNNQNQVLPACEVPVRVLAP